MKIRAVKIDKSKKTMGLNDIDIERLKDLVLLVGVNGAGKTRLFNVLSTYIKEKPTKTEIEKAIKTKNSARDKIKEIEQKLENLVEKDDGLKRSLKDSLNRYNEDIKSLKEKIEWSKISTEPTLAEKYNVVYAFPGSLELDDYKNYTEKENASASSAVSALGCSDLQRGTTAYIREVQSRAWHAQHPNQKIEKKDKEVRQESYDKLKNLIRKFLSTDLDQDEELHPLLFGKKISDANLSPGQIILLQICVQIHAQGSAYQNTVILMDEPENYLHPHACIETINDILECAKECQIWIATHSIPVISYFHHRSTLLFADENSISFKGSQPKIVLDKLLGNADGITYLRDFLGLPSQLAMTQYAAECLLPPQVLSGGILDTQSLQVKKIISQISQKLERPLRVLDFGAGKGRVLENLQTVIKDMKETIEYVAFDPSDADKEHCIGVLESVYGDSEKRYFNRVHEISAEYKSNYFDVVLMCNVLHEIEPNSWPSMFKVNGSVSDQLNNQGLLLLIEDEEIPVGEIAHSKGFIVLDHDELNKLFKVKNEQRIYAESEQDGRLKAFAIPHDLLIQIDNNSKIDALKSRKQRAIDEIAFLRNSDPSFRNGRKNAFWVQQLANAVIALES